MENHFIVTTCRFHTHSDNKLLLVGYFDKNVIGDNHFRVELDGEELQFEYFEKDRQMGNLLTPTGKFVTKDYFIWIDLPIDWQCYKLLKLTNVETNDEYVSFRSSIRPLIKASKHIAMSVDKGEATGEGFMITGWYIHHSDLRIGVFDKYGKEFPMNIVQKQRSDVRRAFPENAPEEIIGFEAVYKGKLPKTVYMRFSTSNKQKTEKIKLVVSKPEKYLRALRQECSKAKVYYQQFGFMATVARVFDKLTGRDVIAYQSWLKRHLPTKSVLKQQRDYEFAFQPKISIVIPLYKTPSQYLHELIASVRQQTYSNWELCLSDGSGEDSPLTSVLQQYEKEDERIKVVYNQKALQISDNTNAALQLATGDYIAFADHDDLLALNALYECVYALNEDQSIDIIYTDEDKVDMSGKEHFMPHFKPDFNLDMLRSVNYICHLFVVKRRIYDQVGMLNHAFDGAQDYDFVLRCIEKTTNIKHIAKILYHWRAHKDSTAENPESKRYAFEAGARAIQAHYERVGIKANVEPTEHLGIYRSKYTLSEQPLISIIIPNKDHIEDLDLCITSLDSTSTYKNYEFVIVENNSTDARTFEYYKELEQKNPRARIVYWEKQGFNYPAINNYGVAQAKGDYLLFLNNDTEFINPNCLSEMLGYCMREDVGAVGAKLYFADGTIQHAGVLIGLGGIAGHSFLGFPHDSLGYFGRLQMVQNYSAVTAACMMVKKSVFEQVEGFDERYAVAFNDVDLCLKIVDAGYRIVYTPYAELNHYESKSRGYEDTEEKVKRFNAEATLLRNRWMNFMLQGDPAYNPNLTLDKHDFSLSMQMNQIR